MLVVLGHGVGIPAGILERTQGPVNVLKALLRQVSV